MGTHVIRWTEKFPLSAVTLAYDRLLAGDDEVSADLADVVLFGVMPEVGVADHLVPSDDGTGNRAFDLRLSRAIDFGLCPPYHRVPERRPRATRARPTGIRFLHPHPRSGTHVDIRVTLIARAL